jgi:hypothetical protein
MNESYGYHSQDKSHKPAAELIKLLIKAVARGGNILLNIGPRGDGKIDDPEVKILQGFARWMDVASEGIYGAGPSGLPVQAWGESTAKGNTIYLHLFEWPASNRLLLGGLESDPVKVVLKNGSVELPFKRLDARTLAIDLPVKPADAEIPMIALMFTGSPVCHAAERLLDPTFLNELHVFDGEIKGDFTGRGKWDRLMYGSGAHGIRLERTGDCLLNWKSPKDYISWSFYVREAGVYEVTACYHGIKAGAGMYVQIDGVKHFVSNSEGKGMDIKQVMGTVSIEAGTHQLEWHITDADGVERLRPQALLLQRCK